MSQIKWTPEMDALIDNLNPGAAIPRGFSLYTRELQLLWLRKNQIKEKKSEATNRRRNHKRG